MISDLLPHDVATVVASEEMASFPLSPAEAEAFSGSSEKRRKEFQAGRAAARLALVELGIRGHDLVPGSDRRPKWPANVVGAITHTNGFCAAAVARTDNYLGVGIDAERLDRPITGGVRDRICHPSELELAQHEPHAAHVIFSAKESYFKTYYPATRHWIGFLDARVTISPNEGTFRIELVATDAPRPAGLTDLTGRYTFTNDTTITAIAAKVENPVNDKSNY